MGYPTSVTSFTTKTSSDVIQPAHVNDLQTEIAALEDALLTTGAAHHLFPDATSRTLGTSSKPWGTTYINALAFIGDTVNTGMTSGLTINQGAADDEIVALKSSDAAHGMTTRVESDTYGVVAKASGAAGGLRLSGYGNTQLGMVIQGFITNADATRSTAGVAAVCIDGYLKTGTDAGSMGSNQNMVAFRDQGATTRFILDSDGDSHQDVGTAWTNFDDRDDVLTLTALSAAVSRHGDPVRDAFGALIEEHRDALEAAKLVTFNEDGHHFINWSRTMMLAIGAIRQQGQQLAAICDHLGLPASHGVRLLPEAR
jgi:hypothetical protein